GLEPPRSLGELDRLLDEHGARPSRDTLHRLAAVNPWAGQLARRSMGPTATGLAVFFIRQRAVEAGHADSIVDRIKADGFTVLQQRYLDAAAQQRVATAVRGGNWERGPYAVSGGPPAV